jgi:hypothetical protein
MAGEDSMPINCAPNDPSSCNEQFPINTLVTKVVLTASTPGDFMRLVVMNNEAVGSFSSLHEYHYNTTTVSIDDVTAFTMNCGTIPATTGDISSFVGSMSLQFNVGQAPSWTRGTYSPTAARAQLYQATDPDDGTKKIGLLLEQNTSGQLTAVTWYKTQSASSIFATTPSSLSFTQVTDSRNNPSTDPNNIGGWTWYYTA